MTDDIRHGPTEEPEPVTAAAPTLRTHVSPRRSSRGPDVLIELLRAAVSQGASDVHLAADQPPTARVDGSLVVLDLPDIGSGERVALTSGDIRSLVGPCLSDAEWAEFEIDRERDFAFDVPDLARFRVNLHVERGRFGAVLRAIPHEVPALDDLGAPAALANVTRLPRGLVLVTGPTGSGKSTTLAAVLGEINRTRAVRIVTIEDPIEFVHAHDRSVISQREVGADTASFASALRHALRQDPDVILVGELRDLDTIRAAMTAAETGHLVLATLHTSGAPESINRLIDVFPAAQQDQARTQLASTLQVVVSQTLLPRATGHGRQLVAEVLVATPAVRSQIRESKVHQLPATMLAGRDQGMTTFDQGLAEQVTRGTVSYRMAHEAAHDGAELARLTGRTAP
ncbi:type IV pilus twitching motility protein PilT [Microbacterium karelineae]|uniref:type IV pilus twitching motility protein PilT n=1 Tax=Microbacterium karelineae TaxID=2654283 RepID=UPI0012E99F57|nr:type IV pilus twitching motility protein PilT [Microbacterium karelineae]